MREPTVAGLLVLTLLLLASLLRFAKVGESPPGFYIDEAAISAQVICVRESGENLQHTKWPLFTPVLGGGYLTPAYLYPAVAWTSVFGDSVTSFREYAAFFSFLFIVGVYVFSLRFWHSQEAAVLAAVSAAISPWVFQFARIAWDPALAPALLVWALALLWGRRRWELALSGVLFSLAAYTYPPLRVQIAIAMPFAILGLGLKRRTWKPYLISVATAVVASLPLLKLTLSGDIQGRFHVLSVFNDDYLRRTYGDASVFNSTFYGVREAVLNFGKMLSPGYLLVSGDANLRHSTGSFGVWSYYDALAVFAALVALALILVKRSELKPSKFRISFVIVGYLAGVLPAALTWESNPHALRSFGATPFLALGVGGALALMWRHSRAMRSAVVGMAFVSFLLFVRVYFTEYPKHAETWFDTSVTDLARTLENESRLRDLPTELRKNGIDYDPMATSYYLLASGVLRCPIEPKSSREDAGEKAIDASL